MQVKENLVPCLLERLGEKKLKTKFLRVYLKVCFRCFLQKAPRIIHVQLSTQKCWKTPNQVKLTTCLAALFRVCWLHLLTTYAPCFKNS